MIAHEEHSYISNSLITPAVNLKILWKDITNSDIAN
jgi:hypothetical protein